MSTVEKFNKTKFRDNPRQAELVNRIRDLIDEYTGEFSFVTAIGILDTVKAEMQHNAFMAEE